MPSRREEIVNYYLRQGGHFKEAAAATRYLFRGTRISEGVVVRVDLNGYSNWTQGHSIIERVALLNDFFTKVIEYLAKYGGIYFRDEGDCIVAIFSPYFGLPVPYAPVKAFCEEVVSKQYGPDGLTAKASVAAGKIVIYQKSHERDTDDWSAEGYPFVRAIRLEQAVESKQAIYYFADEYDGLWKKYTRQATRGERYYWQCAYICKQVQGLGWVKLFEYIPGGKIL